MALARKARAGRRFAKADLMAGSSTADLDSCMELPKMWGHWQQFKTGSGEHSLEKKGDQWVCKICKRSGFRNPEALLATTCFGPGMAGGKVISLQKKEAARARHLEEAQAARVHNAAIAAGRPGVRKHVCIPNGAEHVCEEWGYVVKTEGPPTRHSVRRAVSLDLVLDRRSW